MSRKPRIDKVTLPAAWCSAIINGDYSGLIADPSEADRCAQTVADLHREGYDIVDCDAEARFTWHYQLYDPQANFSGGDVLDYTMLRRS